MTFAVVSRMKYVEHAMSRIFMLIAMLLLCTSSAIGAPCAGFSDVDDTSPFCQYVDWMKNRGVTSGCGVGLYCPDSPVTRLQMSAFMARFANTSAAMYWVDADGAFVGRAVPASYSAVELMYEGKRIVLPLIETYPNGYTFAPYIFTLFFENLNCTGRTYFAAETGTGGNFGAPTLAGIVTSPVAPGLYLSGPVAVNPTFQSRTNGTANNRCVNLSLPTPPQAPVHEALGPYPLPVVKLPLYLR